MKKDVIFFMLVTNRDTYIASYSIKSYQKLIPVFKDYNWKLVVYLNCLKDEFKKTYVEEWKKLDYVETIDNDEFVNRDELIPGSIVKSEEGWPKTMGGQFENGPVVWTREFRKFTSDYWATVDADFEILSPDFIVSAFNMFNENNNLAVVSSDYTDNRYYFDTYSNEYIYAISRYHTWFCIYKNIAQKCKTSHFYYQEIFYGLRFSFDDAAKFQWDLREKFGYEMKAVDKKYEKSFIHYGAFSKNCFLDNFNKVSRYRKIAIFSRRGFFGSDIFIEKLIRKFFILIKKLFYTKITNERGRLNYQSKLDK